MVFLWWEGNGTMDKHQIIQGLQYTEEKEQRPYSNTRL
jgi:hypothetical protein